MAEISATAFKWTGDCLLLLDQRKLPHEEVWVTCKTAEEVAEAIRSMVTRGAPLIGITAAFGVVLAAQQARQKGLPIQAELERASQVLLSARPTAVNLSWAVNRMMNIAREIANLPADDFVARLEEEAVAVYKEDYEANRRIGENGAALLPENCQVLTHCNTGALAVSDLGTALGVIKTAYKQGKVRFVWVDETRPFLQGARLTAWELLKEGIPFKIIVDGAAAWVMQRGWVDAIIVGADRITRNGDVANKIGTYMLAVLAKNHGIPFYVAAPTSTLDISLPSGEHIPIEERDEGEVLGWHGVRVAPENARAFNPSFDVTPSQLVTAIITEKGVAFPPFEESIAKLVQRE
ncbi:MAG: S-methyl-5-thioribose-1-phosphate isomerase [Armatimonadota bacterium]|nr:S-methyl-5-thioribose-1-phosphate isomerase [Armatimonadota bacterium]MDW8143890.1 S-methyl-5-thioribose-1-phosphate isomerase [Armatimonadota bacterium]